MARSRYKICAGENPAGIKPNRVALLQEIVVGITVDQRSDQNINQAFLAVGDVDEAVKKVNRLFFVLRQVFS